ncbi:MAG: hypothetical protein J6R59_12080 [Paludibacteraceae bacterium]|nr:hypothetical protein [Paludibacteraceae bacterium]
MTKRLILTSVICLFTMLQMTSAQYQLENAGFEDWNSKGTIPNGWNTYETAQGNYASTAANAEQCKQGKGHSGQYSVVAVSRVINAVIMKVTANGIVTSGVINAGSMTPTDSKNNNQTIAGDSNKSMAFSGRPDSVVAWIKALPKEQNQLGRFYVMLHDNSSVQDPGTTWANVIAVAGVNPKYNSNWERYTCPFFYYGETHDIESEGDAKRTPGKALSGSERPSYALATISTNYLAGKGSAGDELHVDDIEMIYNSKLVNISVNGTKISGFSKDVYSYKVDQVYQSGMITYESDGRYASVEESFDDATQVLTLTVKGDNYSEDNTNKHVYSISFACPAKINGFAIGGTALAEFSSDKLEYTIDKVYYNVKESISYTNPNCAAVSEVWDEATNTLKVTVTAADTKVYSFKFHAPYGSQLKSLSIAGAPVAGFSPDVYSYKVDNPYDASKLTFTVDDDATYETSFDNTNYVLTIKVKGADFAENSSNEHEYKVQYHAPYESLLTDLKVNGISLTDFSSSNYSYTTPKVYTEGVTKVTYTQSEKATVEVSFDAATLIYKLVVKGVDYADNKENIHTYSIQFHASYDSYLTSLKIDGVSVADFSSSTYSYVSSKVYKDGTTKVAYEQSKEATVSTSFDEKTYIYTLVVKGADFADNESNIHTYKIQFHAPYESYLTSLKVDGVSVADFSSTTYTYSSAKVYTAGETSVTYEQSSEAKVETKFDAASLTYVLVVKGGDYATNSSNTHTYKIKFHASYGSQLQSLAIDGKKISGFSSNRYEYAVSTTYDESKLTIVADADATYELSFDNSSYLLTITVKGGDIADNSTNFHEYKIQYVSPYESFLTDLKLNGTTLSGFSSTKYSYSVPDVYTDGVTKIDFQTSAEATVEKKYDEATQTYTIVVKAADIAVNPENTHSYTIVFHEAYGSQLKSLSLNKVALSDFAADKYDYKVEEIYEEGKVSYEADDEATASHTFDPVTNRLFIKVKGGDYASNNENTHTYTIQFCAKTLLTELTFGGATVPTFRSDKYNYDLSAYSYESDKVAYVATEGAVVTSNYDSETSILTIVVTGTDLDLYPNNKHTYTLQFHASYGSFLTSFTIDGVLLEDFAKTKYSYLVRGAYEDFEKKIDYTVDAEARVRKSFDDQANLLTLVVSGNDIETNPSNTHTYKIQFYAPATLTLLKVNAASVPGFSADKYDYSLASVVYENAKIICQGVSGTTVEKSFDPETNVLSIVVKGSDIATYDDNFKTYKLQFGQPLSSKLVDLKVNGTTIEGFDKDNFQYISTEFYSDGIVGYIADSAATVKTSYDDKNFVLTLRVEGGDYETNSSNYHVYTISFADPTYYGSQLVNVTVNGVQMEGFAKDVYEYYLEGSLSDLKIRYEADELATVTEKFDAEANSLILTVNGGNIKKDPANTHKYVIKFSSSFVFEAYVTSFAINGVDSSFDKLQFNSTINGDYAASDVAIQVSPLAQYCADYDKTTGVLTIVVWAGNFDKNASNFNTYKITFK